MKERSHDEAMVEQFHADPSYAAELLTEVRRNGDSAELAIILRQMAKAFGGNEGWSQAIDCIAEHGIFHGL